MRIVVSGGGTGGHIYPALMVGQEALRRDPHGQCLFIGTEKGLEQQIVPTAGMPFATIDISGFRRSLSWENVRTVWRFVRAVGRAKQLLTEFKPDVVVGTGGYVCGPVVYAATRLGIATLIHEQNAIPGLSNAFLSRFVDGVAVSFPESQRLFRNARSIVYTGNPRATVVRAADARRGYEVLGIAAGSPVVLIFGGSRGALAVNEAVLEMLPQMIADDTVHYVYVTGAVYYERVLQKVREQVGTLPAHVHLFPYLHEMPEVMAATRVMIGRAGASTLAELTALGIPSILIPSPNVTNNHQEKNALALVAAGAAEMIRERELSGSILFARLQQILHAPQRLTSMAQQAEQLGKPDALDCLFRELDRIIETRRKRG